MISKQELINALRSVDHPKKGTNVVAAGAIQSADVNGAVATITLLIDPQDAELMEDVRKECEQAALSLEGITRARAIMTAQRAPSPKSGSKRAPPSPKRMKGVKNVLAVASGKGGVGKSTTSVNLAFALKNLGLRVGLIDCDIYGPSASLLLGVNTKPKFTEDDRIIPVDCNGLLVMSMSFLVDQDTAAVWRGPMVISAVRQFLNGVAWDMNGDLDILIADLPPGTGDVQLTLAQTVNVDGAIIVSTPQDLALIDARKAFDMFLKTNIPTLGVIENMSYFVCPHCGGQTNIFGHGGAKNTAETKGIPFLGSIPLDLEIRESSDAGTPIVMSMPNGECAKAYTEIASTVLKALKKQ